MRGVQIFIVVLSYVVIFAHGQFFVDEIDNFVSSRQIDERVAPWWSALRDESFYKTCHSSCTDYSQGTTTRVELCDDTDVSSNPER